MVIFLDRDGVINEDREDFVKSWEEFFFIPGALEGLSLLSRQGFKLFIITNQSAVGRGLISDEILKGIHTRMLSDIESHGGRIEKIYYCPHHPNENCLCRKPKTGLMDIARTEYDLSGEQAVCIGDSLRDLQAAWEAGCLPILVKTGKGLKTLEEGGLPPQTLIREDLQDAARWIIAHGLSRNE